MQLLYFAIPLQLCGLRIHIYCHYNNYMFCKFINVIKKQKTEDNKP